MNALTVGTRRNKIELSQCRSPSMNALFLISSQADIVTRSINFLNKEEMFRNNIILLDQALLF